MIRDPGLDQLFGASPMPIKQTDPHTGRFIQANEAFCRLTGYTLEELRDKTVEDLTHPADRTTHLRLVPGLPQRDDFVDEKRVLRKDGSAVWVRVTGSLVRDAAGTPLRCFSFVQELTEAKQAAESVLESERRFRLLADSAPVIIWVTNAAGDIEFANREYREFFGIEEEAVRAPGRWHPRVHHDDHAAYVQAFLDAMVHRREFRAEARVRRADGAWRWIASTGMPRFSASGEYLGHVGSSPDITECKEAEQRLAASEAQLRLATEGASVGTFELDLRSGRGQWSPVAMALFGADRAAFTREGWLEAVHPDDRGAAERAWRTAEQHDAPYEIEYRTAAPGADGEPRWLLARGRIERAADGQPLRGAGVLLDVTDRFRMQRQLAEQRTRELAYLDHLPVGVWFMAPDGRIEYGNRAGREIWAGARYVKPEDFGQYQGWWHATGKPIAADQWAAARAIQHGETSLNEEIDIACFDGITRRTILNSAVPVRDAEGRITGAVILNQDITERMRMEAALRDADRRKDEFIATLGHELRNPLAPLRNGVELLRIAGDNADTRQRIVGVMDRQLAHMVRLVDDLLEVSRITRGKIELRCVHADLREVLSSAVETVAATVKASGNALTVQLPQAPLMVDVDPVRITQVMTNLIDNAAKYTQRGNITLRAWQDERAAVFEVRDNGAGIPVEMLERVFEIFTQVDRTLLRAQGGLGIGLALVRQLVEMHGGRVSATSDGIGTGAAFRVELPLLAG